MVIISIILGFILNAGIDARHRAEERATQGLITKLETGLNDRLDALLQSRPDYNNAHLAPGGHLHQQSTRPTSSPPGLPAGAGDCLDGLHQERDARRLLRPEATRNYPINFAGNPVPGNRAGRLTTGYSSLDTYAGYVLPLGNTILGPLAGYPYSPQGTGIFGASYPVAAGIYKNLGYLPAGYDGIDNDGDGLIDDMGEGVNSNNSALVSANLANHTHNTARSEMLYAILVEGRGPLGSVFSRDDFTDREVRTPTGRPARIRRRLGPAAPVLPLAAALSLGPPERAADRAEHRVPGHLDVQPSLCERHPAARAGPARPQSATDGAGWWSSNYNIRSLLRSTARRARLRSAPATGSRRSNLLPPAHRALSIHNPGGPTFWDRGTTYNGRRAFYSKFLILSGGQDLQLGVFLYSECRRCRCRSPIPRQP